MLKPTIPENEMMRLQALKQYNVLDTLPEDAFDNIAKIASLICETPISLVTIIDNKRQFFKAKTGLQINETPKEIAFCAHAINKPDELMIVDDATKDNRFKDNPLVTGNPKIVFYAGMPLVTSDGFALGTLCVIDTQPKHLTNEQTTALKALAGQVLQLLELRKTNIELKKTQTKILEYSKEQATFAYVIAHELKEPLRMVTKFMKLLEQKYKDRLDAKAKQYIQFAFDGALRMTGLINDLLAYAKIDREHLKKEPVATSKLVLDILSIQKNIHGSNLTFEVGALPEIVGYPVLIKLLFQNIISNAIKYQPTLQKIIKIKIDCSEIPDKWQFIIQDNGIGISSDTQNKIFTPFKRLHSGEQYEGTGLGLAVCQKIVVKHGGSIWVESEVGVGSAFFFTITK
ncbi:ATP-binding protein [Hydrotalea sp.]|uniref:GAF domain-containing sensor histidine kinase n=1 Tax=Hydrotalea sp. TaxID=2881279 RepID=UPI00262F43AD|nr:ATP-binding protein [Hydrotalea sp.]